MEIIKLQKALQKLLEIFCYFLFIIKVPEKKSLKKFGNSVSNSGAKAPEWRFWTSQWRLKFSGAGRFLATLKNNLRMIIIMKFVLQF